MENQQNIVTAQGRADKQETTGIVLQNCKIMPDKDLEPGPGAKTDNRVKWSGYKVIDKQEAMKYTVGPFLKGNAWLRANGVPVRFGLSEN
ncbi:pectinesterase [Prunus yedoensis var. nudiflora]|uniref:Pectinesterase n=1 Tax=Prunus yedoensis var. nudiflora TaxID=2094558 RepID=A0A314YK18_PRUYE|nr:pectinesterase [Prunus yedoensis var. nudiflora]